MLIRYINVTFVEKFFIGKYQAGNNLSCIFSDINNRLDMSEDQKKQLEQQLWNIANTLRGKMDADEFH